MRIWFLHPKYLDTKGLVTLWRETLSAKHVLEGKTKGYKNHPQLDRFKNSNNPLDCINSYLAIIHEEATKRQYSFDKDKVDWQFSKQYLTVTRNQLKYEVSHLPGKLQLRDPGKYQDIKKLLSIEPNPLFKVIDCGLRIGKLSISKKMTKQRIPGMKYKDPWIRLRNNLC